MGGGSWTAKAYTSYSASKGRDFDSDLGVLKGNYSEQELFAERHLNDALDPRNVLRECRASEEHPSPVPVILALDVTGSMGDAAKAVATQLNKIMTTLYSKVKDIEFMIMGIGDLAYDRAPIQISQFESDVRIAEQLDKIWFERGGGGNAYESYTASWYMGARHTDLDCWKNGQKGLIITLGDETLNPYLPATELSRATGDDLQADIETKELYREASKKFDIYHVHVKHRSYEYYDCKSSFESVIGAQHYMESSVENVPQTITDIVESFANKNSVGDIHLAEHDSNGEIIW